MLEYAGVRFDISQLKAGLNRDEYRFPMYGASAKGEAGGAGVNTRASFFPEAGRKGATVLGNPLGGENGKA